MEYKEIDGKIYKLTEVTNGSTDWALYQMMQGKRVTHKHLSEKYLHMQEGEDDIVFDDCNGIYCSADEFVKLAPKNGWGIYEEPEPLLAKAKVGDLCQRRDGKWVQIDRLLSIGGMPWICYEIGGLRYINNGEQLNSKLSELGIVSAEPLAPEGSKDWAWQMMLLGKIIIHSEYRHENATWKMNNGTARSCLAGMSACSKEQWVANAIDNGWQIYEKPKPEPQYKVGDWVEYRLHAKSDNNMMGQIIDIGRTGGTAIEVLPVGNYERNSSLSTYHVIYASRIIRKLKPSEVIVNIGCLSGTVRRLNDMLFGLVPIDTCAVVPDASIPFAMLDAKTRKLVEDLLKQIEEES